MNYEKVIKSFKTDRLYKRTERVAFQNKAMK